MLIIGTSIRAFHIIGGLLILLALSLIACSPFLPPAPTLTGGANSPGAPGAGANAQLPAALGQQTKTSGCISANALPDSACTPGAIFPDATTSQICVSGYSSSVRNVPDAVKNQAYAEYGIVSHSPGEYEVDHLISLELGGSNDIANLWPEPANPRPGFHEKDQVENWLHDQVCSGAMPLASAQSGIAQNWLQFYSLAGSSQGASASTPVPLIPPVVSPSAAGHKYVASSLARTYYYCDTDPAWKSLSQSNLVWSNSPAQFIAKGLKLHHPC